MSESFEIPSPYQWDASFDIKNDKLNDQHKQLFSMIDHLDHNRTDAKALNDLLGFVLTHFKTEEDAFDKFHFNDPEHKHSHDKFVQDAKGLKTVGDAEMKFIKNWLVYHIKGQDKKYADTLHGKDV